ncbi:MAG: gamma-glutamylcyclotransferase [Rubrivivax sp.]|nr:gamma-glutamylcyclotransferase [Rubrivivax sp.]
MKWYFAYGSNMDEKRLSKRMEPKGIVAERIGGRLDGWELAFNKRSKVPAKRGQGAGNILVAPGAHVFGTLNLLPPGGLDELDTHEGVADGHYERRTVPVVRTDSGETIEAITYVAQLEDNGLKPTREYLGHLLKGGDLLPGDYLQRLKATPTFD